MDNYRKRITVFTPTYNRGYRIDALYQSLVRQSFTNFEWLVIDDGSSDNTGELFEAWIKESQIEIRYLKIENGGKHRAINQAVKMAEGELFFIVDSDDYLVDNALKIIDMVEKTIPKTEKHKFCSLSGCDAHENGERSGKVFEDATYLDITNLQRAKYGLQFDRATIYRTEILKLYPFPEFSGEKFITEAVVWDKMAYDGLKTRMFNDVLKIIEYLPDGLSAQSTKLFRDNPKGWGLYITQSIQYGKYNGIQKWNEILNYYYTCRGRLTFFEIANNLGMNSLILFFRLFGLRVFYRLYS